MHFKPLLCAGALAFLSVASQAENLTIDVPLIPNPSIAGAYSAAWGATHLEAGAFTDTITFSGSTGGIFDGSLVTIGFAPSTDIDFTSLTINGQAYQVTSSGAVELATFKPEWMSAPLVLSVGGIAAPTLTAGSAISASYAGTANLSPVPEPHTMLLAALGVVCIVGRRRFGA